MGDDVDDLELVRLERAAVGLVLSLIRDGFTVDEALSLVGFPPWPGEEVGP